MDTLNGGVPCLYSYQLYATSLTFCLREHMLMHIFIGCHLMFQVVPETTQSWHLTKSLAASHRTERKDIIAHNLFCICPRIMWVARHASSSCMEVVCLVEELSALYPKKTLMDMYEAATKEPYNFWYILLTAKHKEDMFFLRFEHKIVIDEDAYRRKNDYPR